MKILEEINSAIIEFKLNNRQDPTIIKLNKFMHPTFINEIVNSSHYVINPGLRGINPRELFGLEVEFFEFEGDEQTFFVI